MSKIAFGFLLLVCVVVFLVDRLPEAVAEEKERHPYTCKKLNPGSRAGPKVWACKGLNYQLTYWAEGYGGAR